MADVGIRLQHLKARESAVAKGAIERHIDSEEKKLDEKTKLNRLLETAAAFESDGDITGEENKLLNKQVEREGLTRGLGLDEVWGKLRRADDPGNTDVMERKDKWDNWKKEITHKLEALDDGQAIAQIKLQQLNNQMLNADGARTDMEKQHHDLEKKIRDNIYGSGV